MRHDTGDSDDGGTGTRPSGDDRAGRVRGAGRRKRPTPPFPPFTPPFPPFTSSFRRNRLCKNSENTEPHEKISHWHGKYPPFLRRQESSISSARFALLCRNIRFRQGRAVRRCNVRVPRSICAGFLLSRLCKNSENPEPHEKISHWHGKYPPKTA